MSGCRHKHSTVVKAMIEQDEEVAPALWGYPVYVHQCDMCGLTLPGRPVAVAEWDDPPLLDEEAAHDAFCRNLLTLLRQ